MKFTLSWLHDYLDTTATPAQIADKLTAVGLEVEEVVDLAAKYKGIVVAKVVSCEKHPQADRLNLCLVNTGAEQLQVVCGAANVRAGILVPFAQVGANIPQSNTILQKGVIRGVESNGMICSESELGLTDTSEGILELPSSAKIGQSMADYLGANDVVFDISITPNRADCAGVFGIARDLAAVGLGKLKRPAQNPVPGGFASPINVEIKTTDCPLFIGRTIKNVKNGPSPAWLQNQLKAVGAKPISALVDITNYVCLGLNRPLHVFDADKIAGQTLQVFAAKGGETLHALNDKTYTLPQGAVVIADNAGVQSIGGIMGGMATACTDQTQTVFLESALFTPDAIRKAGQALQIDSDAKYRFERGVDLAFADEGIEIATRLILDICGGEPSETVVAGAPPVWLRTYNYNPSQLKTLGGVDLGVIEQINILLALGFDVRQRPDDILDVVPPSWRADIEGTADIVEEVLRIHGLDKIKPISLVRDKKLNKSALSLDQKRVTDLRRVCAMQGLNETVTWSFHDEKAAGIFALADKTQLRLANPISADLSVMRHSVLPHLITAAQTNHQRGVWNARLFEYGPVMWGDTPDTQPQMLAGLRMGIHPHKPITDKFSAHMMSSGSPIRLLSEEGSLVSARTVDFFDAKTDLWLLLQQAGLNPENMVWDRPADVAGAPSWYHPGRACVVRMGRNVVAYGGELHPAVLQAYDITTPMVAWELNISALPSLKPKKSAAKPLVQLSAFQPVPRDFAFLLNKDTPLKELVKCVGEADKKLITDVVVFDVYSGQGVPEGQISVALRAMLQPVGATFTEAEIDQVSQAIIKAVATKIGGVLRA